MDRLYDERYGDIHFEEEDPQSEFYNPKCIRNVYLDLVNGVFDKAFNLNDDDYYYENDGDDGDDDYDGDDDGDDDYQDEDNFYINGDDVSNYEDISNPQTEDGKVDE
jgi:hypothetical protein